LLQAVLDGRIPLEVLDRKVLRILEAKEKVCLPEPLPYSEAEHERTFQRIAELSMTGWRKDGGDFSPFAEKDRPLFVIVTGDEVEVEGELPAGANQSTELAHKLKSAFRGSELVVIPRSPTTLEMQKVLNKGIQASSICFIAHTPTKCYTGTNRYLAPIVSLAKGLRTKIRTFVIWGNPYASDDLPMEQFLFCYDRGPWIDPMIQVLKGERKPEGKLPVPML
jgi:hypothetical protein